MRYYAVEINPEPWAIGNVGYGRKNGNLYAYVGRNNQLAAFQEAVAGEVRSQDPEFLTGDIQLMFFFWRNRAEYYGDNKRTRKSTPDVTNMQKATEDALQGVLFENDRQVVNIHSILVDSGPNVEGKILIVISNADGNSHRRLAEETFAHARSHLAKQPTESTIEDRMRWGDSEPGI